MSADFFSKPILNSPYAYPSRHWELDELGQPTQKIIETRRPTAFVTPIPKPKKRKSHRVAKSIGRSAMGLVGGGENSISNQSTSAILAPVNIR